MDIFEQIKRDSLAGVKKACKEIDNINAIRTESGDSVLRSAIKNKVSLEVFVFLVEQGADIYEIDEEGVGLIDDAIKKGRLDIVKFLVESGIDPNTTKRKSGFTPLMAAMAYGDEAITRYLVEECNVDTEVLDTFEKSARDYAKMTGYEHLIDILEKRGK
ncbi:ankyrin repeat domain-containing protein [Nitratiruptor tergarcus]|uniref:FOG: Ankyrin repeat n=1 Tax=Nitratiruptor tergarcus DSM 16512 TaxID=1069081 RepID=A0A1W1WQ28_9BACT|nr:ankyrin repeat domain-containing protein [Nitratiruptor tergarcus]SMC08322.1 FOG: Ankyrin repeat [Nitratiruptor tergarcus DSM 16512]